MACNVNSVWSFIDSNFQVFIGSCKQRECKYPISKLPWNTFNLSVNLDSDIGRCYIYRHFVVPLWILRLVTPLKTLTMDIFVETILKHSMIVIRATDPKDFNNIYISPNFFDYRTSAKHWFLITRLPRRLIFFASIYLSMYVGIYDG